MDIEEQMKFLLCEIKKERINQGISLEKMAKKLGYRGPSSYFKIEEGKVILPMTTYIKICTILKKKNRFFLK